MRRAIPPLLLCGVILAAIIWIGLLPGAVRFEAGDLSIDAATSTLVFAALLALAALYVLIRLLARLARLPRHLRQRRARRRQREGDRAVTRALEALAAGHQTEALSQTARARARLGDTPHTLLLAAQAAELAKRGEAAEALYASLAARPDAAIIGLRGLMEHALARQDDAAAAALADRAARAYPNSPWLQAATARLPASRLPAP